MSAPDVLPSRRRLVLGELVAGLAALVGTVLLGAPVGLVWTAVAPRVGVVVAAGEVTVADPTGGAFIAGDGWYVAVTLVAGVVAGAVALAARRHGAGVVVGLAVGGVLAAEVARRTGHLVGLDEARALVRSGRDGAAELALRLRATQAVLVWPLAAVAVHLAGTITAVRARQD